MIRRIFALIVGNRYGFPLIVACALIILIVNESTYRLAMRTLDGGIALTDARLAAGSSLQLITDAETAQRGYLLTGNASYLQPYRKAIDHLPAV
ncbi:MAG: CHASE3 domain-containing protein, partial [Burkholderiaceae bacterium]